MADFLPSGFAGMGAMGGAIAAAQERVQEKELAVKEGELGFRLADLDERKRKAQSELVEKSTTRQFGIFDQYAKNVLALGEQGKFNRGSGADKGFDLVTEQTAKAAKLLGMDPDAIYAAADGIKQQALGVRKQTTVGPDSTVIEAGPNGPTPVYTAPGRPIIRDMPVGHLTVPTAINPRTLQQTPLGPGGPRFNPREGGATLAQQANNSEIIAARRFIDEQQLDTAEIQKRSRQFDENQMPNPQYSPFISRMARIATQRLTGVDDPDFERVHKTVMGGLPALPRTEAGQIDARQLTDGLLYEVPMPDGTVERWRWDAKAKKFTSKTQPGR